jgi:hypothetical protein
VIATRRSGRLLTFALAAVALAFASSGCATGRQEVRALPPLAASGPADAWDDLLAIRRASPRLASYASVRVESHGSRQSFRATVAADENGRLRVDAFSPVGTAAFTLFAEGGETTLVDHVNRTWWTGPFPVAARSLGLPETLDAHDLGMIAFGLPASTGAGAWQSGLVVQGGVAYLVVKEGIAEARGDGWIATFEAPSFPAASVTIASADGSRAMTVRHLEPGAASRGVDAPKIDPSYRCCVEPAVR